MVKTTVSVIILYWCEAPTLRSPNSRNNTSPGSRPDETQINISNISPCLSTCRKDLGWQSHIEDNVGEAAAYLSYLQVKGRDSLPGTLPLQRSSPVRSFKIFFFKSPEDILRKAVRPESALFPWRLPFQGGYFCNLEPGVRLSELSRLGGPMSCLQ